MKRVISILLIFIGLSLITGYGIKAVKSYFLLKQVKQHVTSPVILRSWMTIPYLAKMYQVPDTYLYQRIGIAAQGNEDKSLHTLKKHYFSQAPERLFIRLQTAIADYKKSESL